MKDLLSILHEAPGSIRLEVSGEDLLAFSSNLINRAKEELATQVAEARKVRFLTKEQVKELCGVCDATLWHWNRKGYLKAVRSATRSDIAHRIFNGFSVSGSANSRLRMPGRSPSIRIAEVTEASLCFCQPKTGRKALSRWSQLKNSNP